MTLKQIIQSIDLCMTVHDKKFTRLDLICEIDLYTICLTDRTEQ